ncbi:Esterase FE4 [Eumeta japonica]|uniref:Esterase FE4 n=1 Tax=Eumeta variegata TaxID=151549 RepID=A0A4C1Z6Y2_EUMVA|nr:Esterase FE4 [Eumeta japonica]
MNSRERSSIIEIKQQWRTTKLEAKKKLSSYKKECSGTGGGPKPPSPDSETNEILEIIPQEFEVDSNKFDSDSLSLQNKDLEEICQTKDAEIKTVDSDQIIITPVTSKGTTSRYRLYNTIPSKVKASKRKLPLGVNELATQRTKVLTNCIESEHTLKIEQMRESHEWGKREHELRAKETELRINNLELKNRLLRNKLINNQNIILFKSAWWDWKGIIHYDLLLSSKTINSNLYCQQLMRFKQEVEEKRPELINRKGVIFYKDNVRPHTSLAIQKILKEFVWKSVNLVEQPSPQVKIDQGVLSGRISKNGKFFEFLGVPYAGTNQESRFQPPLPPPTWDGVYRAINEHYQCPQLFAGGFVVGVEDCLKINVYVPVEAAKPLPVMVYIHGGAFLMGSGGKLIYGPEFLVRHDVIVVTFNYRLGSLGFVCLGIKEAPGNAGLRDQIAALKWVKRNIAAFGGDPDNITLFGESAGGTSTSFLIASNLTDGLFNRAIIQSGSFLAHWGINRNPLSASSMLAKELGYNSTDPVELHDILKNVPYDMMVKRRVTKPWDKYFETALIHLPCVEKEFDGIEKIVTDLPMNILHSANRKNITVIIGFNDREGLFLIGEENDVSLRSRNDGFLFASDLEFETDDKGYEVTKKIKEFYFGNEPISSKNILKMAEVHTDLSFAIPQLLESEALCSRGTCDVYNYVFKYDGRRNLVKSMNGYEREKGAAHGDDLFYLFDAQLWPFVFSERDRSMIKRMTTMWTNFAKYNDPTPEITKDLPVKWEKSTRDELRFLHIDEEMEMGPNPRRDEFSLWKKIYAHHHRKKLTR